MASSILKSGMESPLKGQAKVSEEGPLEESEDLDGRRTVEATLRVSFACTLGFGLFGGLRI